MASSSLNFSLFTLSLILVSTSLTTTNGTFSEEVSEAIALKRMEKTTHLHFYFHDILSGKNPTAVKIAGSKDPVMAFGSTFMIDDPLTEGRELTSKLIGKAQGMYAFMSQNSLPKFLMVIKYEFVEGKYNGSSFSLLGQNPVLKRCERNASGGRKWAFPASSGYALAHTVWFDTKTEDATVEYNVYVVHY